MRCPFPSEASPLPSAQCPFSLPLSLPFALATPSLYNQKGPELKGFARLRAWGREGEGEGDETKVERELSTGRRRGEKMRWKTDQYWRTHACFYRRRRRRQREQGGSAQRRKCSRDILLDEEDEPEYCRYI